jgi:hypothetical protein
MVCLLIAASDQWTIKDTVAQILSFVGVFFGALGGAYFADRYARKHQAELDDRHEREEDETIKATLGTGLAANLITLEAMVQEYNRSGMPRVGDMDTGHFNLDRLAAARALGPQRYRDLILISGLIQSCNARHQANHEMEARLRYEILFLLKKPLARWLPEDHEAIRVSMLPYKRHFQQYAKKLEAPIRELLASIAADGIKDADEGIARLRDNVSSGRDLLTDDPPPEQGAPKNG